MMTVIPVIGVKERSAAITQANPRRKAKGEAAMRPIRRERAEPVGPCYSAAESATDPGASWVDSTMHAIRVQPVGETLYLPRVAAPKTIQPAAS